MAEDIRSIRIGKKAERSLADEDRDEQVLRHVHEFPGAHLRHVQRTTGLPLGTTTRILDRLEKEGTIFSETAGAYRRFFPKEGLHKRERVVLGHLAHDRTRAVLETVLDEPGIRHSEIVAKIGISPATLTYHLKQLIEDEVIVARDKGRARYFRVKNPDLVARALGRWAEEPVETERKEEAPAEASEKPAPVYAEEEVAPSTMIGRRAERSLEKEEEKPTEASSGSEKEKEARDAEVRY